MVIFDHPLLPADFEPKIDLASSVSSSSLVILNLGMNNNKHNKAMKLTIFLNITSLSRIFKIVNMSSFKWNLSSRPNIACGIPRNGDGKLK